MLRRRRNVEPTRWRPRGSRSPRRTTRTASWWGSPATPPAAPRCPSRCRESSPGADLGQDVLGELDDVGAPGARGVTLVEPLGERLGQGRQVEEEVLGLDEFGSLTVDPT